jgi:hypothetical protein
MTDSLMWFVRFIADIFVIVLVISFPGRVSRRNEHVPGRALAVNAYFAHLSRLTAPQRWRNLMEA